MEKHEVKKGGAKAWRAFVFVRNSVCLVLGQGRRSGAYQRYSVWTVAPTTKVKMQHPWEIKDVEVLLAFDM